MKPIIKIKNSRGMAILITLTVITLLMVMALELNRRVRSEISLVAVSRDRITLSEMLSSGMNVAFAILIDDKNDSEIDSIQEDWADPEKVKTILSNLPFDAGGEVTLNITDERSRLQVNALVKYPEGNQFNEDQRLLWERFLITATAEHEFPDDMNPTLTLLYSLKDWIDFGDDDAITGLSGAESDYYQDLDPPYSCRNGPIKMIEELLQVQGFTPEIFYGKENIPGIKEYLTENGISEEKEKNYNYNGKININTADVPVLQTLLPEENQDLALAISDYRIEKSDDNFVNDLKGATWYKNVPGCGDIKIKPELITNMSDLFRVELTAKLNDLKITRTVIIKRVKDSKTNKYICKVLKLRQE